MKPTKLFRSIRNIDMLKLVPRRAFENYIASNMKEIQACNNLLEAKRIIRSGKFHQQIDSDSKNKVVLIITPDDISVRPFKLVVTNKGIEVREWHLKTFK